MARTDALARLAWAYGLHQARRRLGRKRAQVSSLVDINASDGIKPLTDSEQAEHPRLMTCINCGLCALAAGRIGKTRLPDLASSYMRLYARVSDASIDVVGEGPDLVAASMVCPVGLPLDEVAAVVRRLTTS